MALYYVNRNAQPDSGDHEVHVSTCSYLPREENRRYLGDFSHCRPAVLAARTLYADSNGCAHCCPDCHTT